MSRARPPRTGLRFLDEPRERGAVVAMAHRGGALHPDNLGLENTLAAFGGAVRLGYRYLETDVHATADGVLLAFHDTALDRVTDRTGPLAGSSYGEVADALVGGREPIPRLADLVEAFPEARFNVDIKAPAAVRPLVELVVSRGLHDRVCVGSFHERLLRGFRRELARRSPLPVATSCGVASVAAALLPGGHRLGRLLGDPGVVLQVPQRHGRVTVVDAAFVAAAHAAGRHVHVWTVNDPARMEELLDIGVDGLITDRTDLLKDVLVRRGAWW